MIAKYISDDWKEFDSKMECMQWEVRCKIVNLLFRHTHTPNREEAEEIADLIMANFCVMENGSSAPISKVTGI